MGERMQRGEVRVSTIRTRAIKDEVKREVRENTKTGTERAKVKRGINKRVKGGDRSKRRNAFNATSTR